MVMKKGSKKVREKTVVDQELLSIDDDIASVAINLIDRGFSLDGLKELERLRQKRDKIAYMLSFEDKEPMPLSEYLQKNP